MMALGGETGYYSVKISCYLLPNQPPHNYTVIYQAAYWAMGQKRGKGKEENGDLGRGF